MQVLTFSEARHLVSRTGLGAEWVTIKTLEGMPRDKAIQWLLSRPVSQPKSPSPMTPWYKLEPMRLINPQGRKRAWMIAQREGKQLQGWWLEHLLSTRSPFVERMTLFWHGLFTSSIQKTLQPSLLHKQNLILRKHAMGNFRHLLHAIVKDPAMLVYLDGYKNMSGAPNENFARELLELFTLGRKHYREADVKAATQAFTGWTVDEKTAQFIKQPHQQNRQRITFLGRTGQLQGEDIVDIILEQPRTAIHIVEHLWHAFVNPNRLEGNAINQLAQQFRQSGYDIKVLMAAMLASEPFWAPRHKGSITKSPIDILVGSVRMIPYPQQNTVEMVNLCRLLGQELFDPPTVKGWPGAENWINTQTLLIRTSYLTKLSRGNLNRRVDTGLKLPDSDETTTLEWMLAIPPLNPLPEVLGQRRLVRALLLDPAYQVH